MRLFFACVFISLLLLLAPLNSLAQGDSGLALSASMRASHVPQIGLVFQTGRMFEIGAYGYAADGVQRWFVMSYAAGRFSVGDAEVLYLGAGLHRWTNLSRTRRIGPFVGWSTQLTDRAKARTDIMIGVNTFSRSVSMEGSGISLEYRLW